MFVMDQDQQTSLSRAFPHHPAVARVVTLHIKDDYHFLDPELVSMLKERVTPYLDRLRADAAHSQSRTPN